MTATLVDSKPAKQSSHNRMKWLIALNMLALMFLGGKYWMNARRIQQERRRQAESNAVSLVDMKLFNREDSTRLFELADEYDKGGSVSDEELQWFIGRLKSDDMPYNKAALRRNYVCNALYKAVPGLSAAQKSKLFDAMVAETHLDNPAYEIGSDLSDPAKIMAQIGDPRAVPILHSLLSDSRAAVHFNIERALQKLEGKGQK